MGFRTVWRRWMNEGTVLRDRPFVDFQGAGVDVTDDNTNNKTVVTIAGGGVTDHGALTGLADDDHPQYVHEGSAIAKGDMIAAPGANDYQRFAVGSDGKVLTADSAATVGVSWQTPAAETLPVSIIDAKGDLIAGTAADTAARLPVGTNGYVLSAASGESTGLLWVPRRYATVQEEGSDLTQRSKLDFRGVGVEAVDDSGNDKTIVRVRGRRPYLRRSHQGADYALASATPTNLTFDTTDYNLAPEGGSTFTVVSNTLWTPPESGIYDVICQVTFQGHASTGTQLRRIVSLYNNTDAVTVAQNILPSLQSGAQPLVISMPWSGPLNSTKQYAIRARQDSGGSLNIGFGFTDFSVTWSGPSS